MVAGYNCVRAVPPILHLVREVTVEMRLETATTTSQAAAIHGLNFSKLE